MYVTGELSRVAEYDEPWSVSEINIVQGAICSDGSLVSYRMDGSGLSSGLRLGWKASGYYVGTHSARNTPRTD